MGQRRLEWNKRIEIWIEEMQNQVYEELSPVCFEGFMTKDRLSYEDTMKYSYIPMTEGTKWGEKWEYGWFRATITLPESAEGKSIYLVPGIGGEMLVWINGKAVGAVDLEHHGIMLTQDGQKGDTFTVLLESYAGHGPRLENGGPCPPERVAVPEPPSFQQTIGKSHYGTWDKIAFSLAMDVVTLYKLYLSLDPKALRAEKLREGLMEFSKLVDFELPRRERINTFEAARKVLEPLLSCSNGSTAPSYTIFGQSHLDLAWKWPWEETRRKCGRTISTQLTLSDEYPEYKFLICEPVILESIRKDYPELFDRVKDKVEKGQFIPEGGMWVEPDTNMPSGESLIRQCIWGKRWFKEELGYDTKMVWLPDCFGFSGQLPQIFIGTGMRYFTTQKIARAFKGHEVFPFNIFQWEGIDGTRILTHFYVKNNTQYDPQLLNNRWYHDRVQQDTIDTFLFPFGYGDGGGGPTREMLEVVRRTKDLEGAPRTKLQSPIAFFEDIEQRNQSKNRYVGEIYLAWHRGSYTAQAKTKKGNRKAEVALHELEFWGSVFHDLDMEALRELWSKLLFQQFHDILAGTSITRVHQEAEKDYATILEGANKLTKRILVDQTTTLKLSEEGEGITVLNSLSWERLVVTELPRHWAEAFDNLGNQLQTQQLKETLYAMVKVPSCGYTSIYSSRGSQRKVNKNQNNQLTGVRVTAYSIENRYLQIVLDQFGQITSIVDKEKGTEFAAGLCNRICMYQDINIDYDAWELANYYDELPIPLQEDAQTEVIVEGPLMGILRIRRTLNQSKMEQDIVMTAESRRVDFKTIIDWQETHKLLKVEFPVQILADEAIEEIQFGYVKRPTHSSRVFDADRFEVCNHRYTALTEHNRCFAVLNDCKYGVSTKDNNIQLSLLRSPIIPDMYADKGIQEFTYAIYAELCSFSESKIIQQGYELNMPVLTVEGAAGENSYFSLSNQNIILETVKIAEDGSNNIILRLYETKKAHIECSLDIGLQVQEVYEVNMLEELQNGKMLELAKDPVGYSSIMLTFRPFEIKTLRIIMQSKQ